MSAKSEVEKYISELKDKRTETKEGGKAYEIIGAKIRAANKVKSIYERELSFDDFMALDSKK